MPDDDDDDRIPLELGEPSAPRPASARRTAGRGPRRTQALLLAALAALLLVLALAGFTDLLQADDEPAVTDDETTTTQPHLLLILADDLGWNDVGYQSSDLAGATPTIDALAAEGRVLQHYYAEPVCTPSRGALLAGRYPHNVGLQRALLEPCSPYGLDPAATTLAQRLRDDAGYATAMVGKWHLGYSAEALTPPERGFDDFLGFYNGYEGYYDHDIAERELNWTAADFHDGGEPVAAAVAGQYNMELFAARASAVVAAHDAAAQPLFLYAALPTPHFPLDAPPAALLAGDDDDDPCAAVADDARRDFCALVRALDWTVANLTRAFQDAGLWDDTLLVFVSDNGGSNAWAGNNWPLRGDKGSQWEGGVHVPGFVAGGALAEDLRGSQAEGLVHATDWAPTLLAAAGVALDDSDAADLDGVSAWPLLSDLAGASARDEVPCLWQWADTDGLAPTASLRQGDWKLLVNPSNGSWNAPGEYAAVAPGHKQPQNGTFLFNIADDPYEQTDLAAAEPDRLADMLARLDEIQAAQGPAFDILAVDEGCDPAASGVWEPWLAEPPAL